MDGPSRIAGVSPTELVRARSTIMRLAPLVGAVLVVWLLVNLGRAPTAQAAGGDRSCAIETFASSPFQVETGRSVSLQGTGSCWPSASPASTYAARFAFSGSATVDGCLGGPVDQQPWITLLGSLTVDGDNDLGDFVTRATLTVDQPTSASEPGQISTAAGHYGPLVWTLNRQFIDDPCLGTGETTLSARGSMLGVGPTS